MRGVFGLRRDREGFTQNLDHFRFSGTVRADKQRNGSGRAVTHRLRVDVIADHLDGAGLTDDTLVVRAVAHNVEYGDFLRQTGDADFIRTAESEENADPLGGIHQHKRILHGEVFRRIFGEQI